MKGRQRLLAVLAALFLLAPVALLRSGAAAAHPLGNFTVNQFTRIELYADLVRVHYVVDMAEIPAFQELANLDTDGDGAASAEESAAYVERVAPVLLANLRLEAGGATLALERAGGSVALLEGQAGLDTLRITLDLQAMAPGGGALTLAFSDSNYSDRLGWREVVVRAGEGVAFSGATVPAESVSDELRTYPDDMLSSPLDVRQASVVYTPGTGVAAPALAGEAAGSRGQVPSGPGGQAFVDLVSVDELTLPVVVLSLLAAFALGAVHALSPGHGKTIVAAYFVGSGGTPRQALFLALTVTLAHTVGVLALAAVTLWASEYVLPEDLYPVLTLGSGLILVAFGLGLLWSRVRGRRARPGVAASIGGRRHAHGPGVAHDHRHDHDALSALEHARAHLAGQTAASGMPWRSLLTLGISGGILPSPTALIVLLGAISLHRLGFGLLLILSFSLGLATVLTGVGLAFVLAQRYMARLPMSDRVMRFAPTAAAVAITAFGVVLATRGVLNV